MLPGGGAARVLADAAFTDHLDVVADLALALAWVLTLALMAARKPDGPEALRAIKGVGEKKAAELGLLFLEAIAARLAEREEQRARTAD